MKIDSCAFLLPNVLMNTEHKKATPHDRFWQQVLFRLQTASFAAHVERSELQATAPLF